jgi:carbamoyl-phosphate synthase large subunit
MTTAVKVSNDSPVLLDRFLDVAIEVDVDACCDGEDVLIGGIMEHVEQAGVHSGRFRLLAASPTVFPPKPRPSCASRPRKLAKALNVIGLMNIQFAIQSGVIYVLEVNPRAVAHRAIRVEGHGRAARQDRRARHDRQEDEDMDKVGEVVPPYFSVKEAVFPFTKFPEADPILGTRDEEHGRGHGHGTHVRRGLREGAGGLGRDAAALGVVLISVATATRRARWSWRRSSSIRASNSPPPTARPSHHRCGLPCKARQQGARGPAAHRRHDQERRSSR